MLMEDIKINKDVTLEHLKIDNEEFFKISNNDQMRPFFMSIVSNSNHWMFVASNGGITAGRKNAEFSLFPYYTDDKITETADITGSKSIFQIEKLGKTYMWEPFSERFEGRFQITRNLYKNVYGNKILFEEINHDLDLIFRYQWNSSDHFGFVKKSQLINSDTTNVNITILDGIQNILPYGVSSNLQNASSNLVDAYKRSELEETTGLGIFALSAIIVDKAEPSEALKANVVWSTGLKNATYLLSSQQLKKFRNQQLIVQEIDVKAEKGAYFVHSEISLTSNSDKQWMFIADVNKNHAAIAELSKTINEEVKLFEKVLNDVESGTQSLIMLNAASDGLQLSADVYKDKRHFANTLFNIMRGGIFDDNYKIERWDFKNYLQKANKKVARNNQEIVDGLPEVFSMFKLKEVTEGSNDKNFRRLCLEYMPLKFSRRHGDPSRPWNKFSINTRSEIDGSKILDYEGNWRDIFQNWEALALSYPEFIENMIHKFLNATTFDGYNPYRVTKDGFDWEAIEPDDPWSYIGYWGDHQIIYLLKFLEFSENLTPKKLESFFNEDVFVYANVPYQIKSYQEILKNSKDTINFDKELDQKIRNERNEIGADAALLKDESQTTVTVNFIEKILATILAKLSNFIPEGGIWMNTQRPEWNDANNALVGNGVSMVTLYYLRRFFDFFENVFTTSKTDKIEISKELVSFFKSVVSTFDEYQHILSGTFNDVQRKEVLDALGKAGSDYRNRIYIDAFSGSKEVLTISELNHFVRITLKYLEHSIAANKRSDNLYHAYNLMTINRDEVSISYLDEMLEGQVAVLSSKHLTSQEVLAVLDAMKKSNLFRRDQYSYLLYPYKNLKGFMARNIIALKSFERSHLLQQLIVDGNTQIIEKDVKGVYHFNGNFRNATDLKKALNELPSAYKKQLVKEEDKVLELFEEVFNHKAFTGRSGTFYGYEGLGSIYWHMVSKLQLAVQECCLKAINDKESEQIIGRLLEHYYEINEGIGVHKSPELYGAFPTDPYSHTPAGKGVQQPGMTGQVKEDILSRFGELGVFVKEGKLYFDPCLLRKEEFLKVSTKFNYVNIFREKQTILLPEKSMCFTYCQVPIVYKITGTALMEVKFKNNRSRTFDSLSLDLNTSREIFNRSGKVMQINVHIKMSDLN